MYDFSVTTPRETNKLKTKRAQQISEWSYFAMHDHAYEGMRGLNVGLLPHSFLLSIDYSAIREDR